MLESIKHFRMCKQCVCGAGVNIMAGATVGGGTRINWSVSFRTPPHVRKEWDLVNGLPNFTSERYDRAMDAVCSRLGVKTGQTRLCLKFAAKFAEACCWHCIGQCCCVACQFG